MIEYAKEYIARGWAILPLHSIDGGRCTCGRLDCSSPGKHPRISRGVKDATKSPELVEHWWGQWPSANIAIATGDVSGLLVVDIDGEDGEEALRIIEKVHGQTPPTIEALTGNGRHLYFRIPDSRIKNAVRIAPGIDIRSTGGYVVAPPSNHVSGRSYEWEVSVHPDDIEASVAPRWLIKELTKSGTFPVRETADNKATSSLPQGERNATLAAIAGAMRKRGVDYEAIDAALQIHNQRACVPPLVSREVTQIAQSIGRYTPDDAKEIGELILESWHEEIPEPSSYIVDTILPRESKIIVGAEMKTGKTWLTLEIALAVASGGMVLDTWQAQQGNVLIYSPEGGGRALRRRLWAMAWGKELDPSVVGHRIKIIGESLRMGDPNICTKLLNTVSTKETDLLILDPLVSLNYGVDENTIEIHKILDEISSVVQMNTNICVLICHHLGKMHKDRSRIHGLRGSTAIGAWMDGGIFMSMEDGEENAIRNLSFVLRDGPSPAPSGFQLISTPPPRGAPTGLYTIKLSSCEPFGKASASLTDQVYDQVKQSPGEYTVKDLEEEIGAPYSAVKIAVDNLKKHGRVEFRGKKLWLA